MRQVAELQLGQSAYSYRLQDVARGAVLSFMGAEPPDSIIYCDTSWSRVANIRLVLDSLLSRS